MDSLGRPEIIRTPSKVSDDASSRNDTAAPIYRNDELGHMIQDFYYVDDLQASHIAECLYRRYCDDKPFTYFGNLLFYLMQAKGRALQDEYARYLYADGEQEPHLFSLMNEILHSIKTKKKRADVRLSKSQPELPELVRSVTQSFVDNLEVHTSHDNYNILVYGDGIYEQLRVATHAAVYLTQGAHVVGLEPSGTLSDYLSAANSLLEHFNDYSTHGNRFCNIQITYKLNFGKTNQLDSINLIPNLATDISCYAVSSTHRKLLDKKVKMSKFKHIVYRPPSVFYAILYTAISGKHKKWISTSRLTPTDAQRILEMLPQHEIEAEADHVATFEHTVKLLLHIGFSVEEVTSFIQILTAILLFDTYNILRSRMASDHDQPDAANKDNDTNTSKKTSDRPVLNPKDVIVFAADVLEIGLLRMPAKALKSQDLLFKLEIMGTNNQWQFDNLPAALYIRLKHMLYRKINTCLAIRYGGVAMISIAVHCNAGNFPQSMPVDNNGDLEIAKRGAEEAFVHHFINSTDCMDLMAVNQDFIIRNNAAMGKIIGDPGLLARIVMESQKQTSDTSEEHTWRDSDRTTVEHSCQDVEYDIATIIHNESVSFSIPKGIAKLFSYSKNKMLLGLFFSKTSLHHVFGACAASLSYLMFLKKCLSAGDSTYYVACTIPNICSRLYREHRKKGTAIVRRLRRHNDGSEAAKHSHEENATEALVRALSCNIPVLDLCIAQRDTSRTVLDLKSALRTFLPLAYVALPPQLHNAIACADDAEAITFLLSALKAPESMYEIHDNIVVLPKTLCIKLAARVSNYVSNTIDSIRIIQGWWVGYNTMQLKGVLRRMVVRLQSRIRSVIFQDRVAALVSARNLSLDFIGLCVTIYHLNVSLNASSHKTLQLLHSMEKRYHEKEFNHIQYAAAAYIQACWRGTLTRRRYAKLRHAKFEEFAAVLLQATIRRFLATASIVHKKPSRETAAICIQATYRGYRARCEYEKLTGLKLALLSIIRKGSKLLSMSEHLKFVKERKKHNMTTMQMKKLIIMQTNLPPGFVKAQNLFRMYFIRKQYLNLRSALEKVQALALTKLARWSYMEKVRAAVVIQRWWRSVHKHDMVRLSHNAVYYLNLREQAAIALLRSACNSIGVTIVQFALYQDIRRIYPRSWAMDPLDILGHLMQLQRTNVDGEAPVFPAIIGLQFAIGAYHSLLLLFFSNGTSSLYSWGAPSVLDAKPYRRAPLTEQEDAVDDTGLVVKKMAQPLVFCKDDPAARSEAVLPQLSPRPRINITAIACGNDFSLALSTDGQLFTWGNNHDGQCGQGHRLVYVWSPTLLRLYGVTKISCGEQHSVVQVSVGDYFTFGRVFGDVLYTPEDLKSYCEAVRYQRIESVVCAGFLTILYTAELSYVLRVLGHLHNFNELYNLRGNIKSVCTNGHMICALVEREVEHTSGVKQQDQRLYAWGHLRCVSKHFKETLPNTTLLVNAFCERFENQDKRKPRRSMLKVDSQLAKSTFIPMPTEVAFYKKVVDIKCDHQQLILICQNGVVFGAQVFELLHDNPGDIRESDEYSIKLNPQVTNVQLEPALYQFTALEKGSGTVQVAYNRLASSICYATQ